jgi:hypothetical protein
MKDKILVGHCGVDSGQLVITDPCYIDSEWIKKDVKLDKGGHFKKVKEGEFSYAGACQATLSKGHVGGQLNYKLGHAGVGVAIGGFGGDGYFPVYAYLDKDGLVEKVDIDFTSE